MSKLKIVLKFTVESHLYIYTNYKVHEWGEKDGFLSETCSFNKHLLTCIFGCEFQLQVPDESLSLVMSMGFRERDAKRALRMSNQDVSSAVDFLVEQKVKRAQKREDDIRRRNEIM